MKLYDNDGNEIELISSKQTELANMSGALIYPTIRNDNFDMSNYGVVYMFSQFPNDYSSSANNYKVNAVTSQDIFDTFYEDYLGWNGNLCVTKKLLGHDTSGIYPVWEYDFKPKQAKRKILLTSGVHGHEITAVFGVARWIKEYMESNEPVFEYLRSNVQVCVIPVVDPWAFNHTPEKTYANSRGVNPNRNYNTWDNTWYDFPVYTPEQNEWNVKGEYPWSEEETRIVTEFVKNNSDAVFYIDCHTGIGWKNSRTGEWPGEVWIYQSSDNPLNNKIEGAFNSLVSHYQTYSGGANATGLRYMDDDTFINGYYFQNNVGVPMMTLEMGQGKNGSVVWGSLSPYNNPQMIVEYTKQLHGFIVGQLK